MEGPSINNTNKVLEYVLTNQAPLEANFFSESERIKLEALKKKYADTEDYLFAMMNNQNLAQNLDKDVAMGKIFSAAEADTAANTLDALKGVGNRSPIQKSLVSPTGQFVILSDRLSNQLGIIADGYLDDEADVADFAQALQAEGVSQGNVDKIPQAFRQYGAIIFQKGCMTPLMSFLDNVSEVARVGAPQQSMPSAHGASLNALKGIIESSKPVAPLAPKGLAMTPNEIKREVSTKELSGPNVPPPTPKPVMPLVQPRPAAPPPPAPRPTPPAPPAAISLNRNPKLGLASLKNMQVVDDLKKIEPAHLRQGALADQIRLIHSKISSLAQANHLLPIQVESVFQQSALFKVYLQIGNAIMSATTPGQKPDYRIVVAGLVNRGQEVLTLEEFEAMADLRKELEKI